MGKITVPNTPITGGSFIEACKDKLSSKEAISTKSKITHVIKNNENIKNT